MWNITFTFGWYSILICHGDVINLQGHIITCLVTNHLLETDKNCAQPRKDALMCSALVSTLFLTFAYCLKDSSHCSRHKYHISHCQRVVVNVCSNISVEELRYCGSCSSMIPFPIRNGPCIYLWLCRSSLFSRDQSVKHRTSCDFHTISGPRALQWYITYRWCRKTAIRILRVSTEMRMLW